MPRGDEVSDASFLLFFNAHHEALRFRMPTRRFGTRWELELSTAAPERRGGESFGPREEMEVESRSIVVMRRAG